MDSDFPEHEEFSNYIKAKGNYLNALERRYIASKTAVKSESGIKVLQVYVVFIIISNYRHVKE